MIPTDAITIASGKYIRGDMMFFDTYLDYSESTERYYVSIDEKIKLTTTDPIEAVTELMMLSKSRTIKFNEYI